MKVKIDEELCIGCGLCEENMPALFIMKNQIAHVLNQTAEGLDIKEIKDTAEDCPVDAIIVEDE